MTGCMHQLAEKRRSIYNLGNRPLLSQQEIIRLVRHAVKYAPSAFNSQPCRVVILFDQASEQLWRLTLDTLVKVTPADRFPATEAKIHSFAAGLGTLLFFNDQDTTNALQSQFPLYADKFPLWAEQAAGILQYLVWTSLAEYNIGASLQHYNPLIDQAVKNQWQLPASWQLNAQMPFGSIEKPAGEKTFLSLDQRVLTFS